MITSANLSGKAGQAPINYLPLLAETVELGLHNESGEDSAQRTGP